MTLQLWAEAAEDPTSRAAFRTLSADFASAVLIATATAGVVDELNSFGSRRWS